MGLKSFALLGWQFLLHLLSRLTFTYRRRGAARFHENFAPEHLLPLTPEDRQMLPLWQSCIVCGLCDAVCPELLSPELIATGMLGDLTKLGLVTQEASALTRCEGCSDCEAICPVGLPLRDLAAFIVRMGQQKA